jgi:hypothetical protein
VSDNHSSVGSIINAVEEPSAEARGSLTNHETIHSHRAGSNRCTQSGSAELQTSRKTFGEFVRLAALRCGDQLSELGADIAVGLGFEPTAGSVKQQRFR